MLLYSVATIGARAVWLPSLLKSACCCSLPEPDARCYAVPPARLQVRPSSKHDAPYWTTNSGAPVWNNKNSLTVGARGPILLEDYHLVEKLANFDRERIPERVVHARGASAKGFFEVRAPVPKHPLATQPGRCAWTCTRGLPASPGKMPTHPPLLYSLCLLCISR
jgi:hypothetical protein